MDLQSVYGQVILEYSRKKEHHHQLSDATVAERGHNPNCGDDLTLMVKEKDGIIESASFLGAGCAVSTASMNMLLEVIIGKSVAEAQAIVELFFTMMGGTPLTDGQKEQLQDACLLDYFANMPARKKCATLGWHCARVALEKAES